MANEDDGVSRLYVEAVGSCVAATVLLLKTPATDLNRAVDLAMGEAANLDPGCDDDPRRLMMATMRWCLAKLEAAPA